MPETEEIDAAFDCLIEAIARRDLSRTLTAFSADPAAAVLGSEARESAKGTAEIETFFRRIFARPGSFRFELPERSWTVHGAVAWLVAEGTVIEPAGGAAKPYRLTAILVRDHTVWKVALWSGAEPADS